MGVEKCYLCIDLKSFYASVECVARGLDPFVTNLVVADPDRTDKTICLAITPAMKALGVMNRCRVFEIPPEVDYLMAKPRMKRYMEVSADIYSVYLRYVSPEDIHVYSIDECFIDATPYLSLYGVTPKEFANLLMDAVFQETGICATAGIGTNLFLAKVALDITAKHVDDHIGVLDEESFRREIWRHRPITDIWNVGPGIARRLAKYRIFDLEGVTKIDQDLLYKEFGVNAEYLIDHAWGYEPCTIAQIQAFVPEGSSLTNGQVLSCDYTYEQAYTVLREMIDSSVLELIDKGLVASGISLMVGYAKHGGPARTEETMRSVQYEEGGVVVSAFEGLTAEPGVAPESGLAKRAAVFEGGHGKRFEKWPGGHTGGSRKLSGRTNSRRELIEAYDRLFAETTRPDVAIRRINLGMSGLMPEEFADYDLFTDFDARDKERKLQEAILSVKGKFGGNALLKGTSLKSGATGMERNEQVGGHHA